MAAEPIQTMSTSAIRKRKPDVTGPRVYQAASTKIAHFASCSLRLSGKDVERQARVRLLAVIMVAVTVPRRFAVPGTGEIVGVDFALGLIVTVFGLGRGILRTEPRRLVLYAVMIGGLLVTLLVKSSPYSLSSFLMLAVLCLPFIAMFRVRVAEYRQGPNDLQRLMALLAVAGLLQMAVQFVAKPEWMFPLDMFLPEQLFISQFNLRIPITDSLPYLKGNGLVFLEPSHFSQFLAFSILIEPAYFRRFPRLALLGLAYLTSFRDRRDTVVHCCNAAHSAPSTIFNAAIPPLPASCCFLGYMIFSPSRCSWPASMSSPTRSEADRVIGVGSFLPFYLYALLAHSPDRLLSFAYLAQFLLRGGFLNSFYVPCLSWMAARYNNRSGPAPAYWFRSMVCAGVVPSGGA